MSTQFMDPRFIHAPPPNSTTLICAIRLPFYPYKLPQVKTVSQNLEIAFLHKNKTIYLFTHFKKLPMIMTNNILLTNKHDNPRPIDNYPEYCI